MVQKLRTAVIYTVQRSRPILNEMKDLFYLTSDPSKLRMREARTLNLEP
jgi:hypothetical protein